jgi:tRNA uridine 5-carboxymethylaminomethyl modification enzyme
LKTGTPQRINGNSIDFSRLEIQQPDSEPMLFRYYYDEPRPVLSAALPCWITYTGPETHEIIRNNISRSPLYQG